MSSVGRGQAQQSKCPRLEPAPFKRPRATALSSTKRPRTAEPQARQQNYESARKKLFTEKEYCGADKLGLAGDGGVTKAKGGGGGGGEGKVRWSEEERQRVAQLLVSTLVLQYRS